MSEATSNDYHFITTWRVRSTPEEVTQVLAAPEDLPRWWPSVYLGVKVLEPGGEDGVGEVVDLYTKGWLPYTLRWTFKISESRYPDGFTLQAWGDFVGRGIWTFVADGPWVDITYDWQIRADKPLLRYLSFVMKPIFSANHHWAMARGEESLLLELARRRAASVETRALVPAPPPPTPQWPFAALGAAALAGAAALVLTRRRKRKG